MARRLPKRSLSLDGEQRCVCGHPQRLHWLRERDRRIEPQRIRFSQYYAAVVIDEGPLTHHECAMPCSCGAFESAEKSSARKVSQG